MSRNEDTYLDSIFTKVFHLLSRYSPIIICELVRITLNLSFSKLE